MVCFAFLIIQYRVFQSHYFCHIINDTKASTILASRGAELIEDLKKKQMEQEMEHESKMLKKLKMKMDRIKATQKKFLEPVIDQPKTHAQGKLPFLIILFYSRTMCFTAIWLIFLNQCLVIKNDNKMIFVTFKMPFWVIFLKIYIEF